MRFVWRRRRNPSPYKFYRTNWELQDPRPDRFLILRAPNSKKEKKDPRIDVCVVSSTIVSNESRPWTTNWTRYSFIHYRNIVWPSTIILASTIIDYPTMPPPRKKQKELDGNVPMNTDIDEEEPSSPSCTVVSNAASASMKLKCLKCFRAARKGESVNIVY